MASSNWPIGCILRPAQLQDRRAIAQLTQQLHQTAFPHGQPWRHWWLWFGVGVLAILWWHRLEWGVALLLGIVPLGLLGLGLWRLLQLTGEHHWSRYWVLDYQGAVIGCGRMDDHPTHSEIYDLYILPEWRGRGLGRALVQCLLQRARRPIYLASLPQTVTFYQGLGFQAIDARRLHPLVCNRLSLTHPNYRQVGLQAMMLPHHRRSQSQRVSSETL
jgi:N-acetylglutamate synthase-like GNAT family acetyltransferase